MPHLAHIRLQGLWPHTAHPVRLLGRFDVGALVYAIAPDRDLEWTRRPKETPDAFDSRVCRDILDRRRRRARLGGCREMQRVLDGLGIERQAARLGAQVGAAAARLEEAGKHRGGRKKRVKITEVGVTPLDPMFQEAAQPYTPGSLAKKPRRTCSSHGCGKRMKIRKRSRRVSWTPS
jgi:hypothetical protein